MKNVASDLQPGAQRIDRSSAQQPECTWGVHEGESGIGAACRGRSQRLETPLPGWTAEVGRAPFRLEPAASPGQGRAVLFLQHANGGVGRFIDQRQLITVPFTALWQIRPAAGFGVSGV